MKKGKERLVIIGNGMAGTACLEEILRADPDRFDITVFGAEAHNYNRVLLSQVLTGEKTLEAIRLHDPNWYEERGVRLFAGCRVREIKRGSRIVISEGGLDAGYDRLIITTGARPFIPPIPGSDKEGVVSFRDIEDCERIRSLSGKGLRAVILGGGLLGLEAAYGLLSIGLKVTVVHLTDRLMERQLDGVAASLLKDDLVKAGMRIMLGKETVEITGEKKVEALRFKDGSSIGADMVLVSVGIVPDIRLARSSGIYCEKGIVVSDTMQTYDPRVYAVGECVQHRGLTFGLVGPVFEQARVLANHVAGDSRLYFINRPASARLKVPGIDLYSAGVANEDKRTSSIEYLDRQERTYKKIFVRDDRITGIVMYGDTGSAPVLYSYLLAGEDISGRRKNLLLESAPDRAASSIEEMPDDAIVCGCNGVTKGMIVRAIEKKGLFTRDDVKRETRAGSSCGGCAFTIDRILEATLGSSFQGGPVPANICGCTKYSRDDVIKNIREAGLRSVKDVMETLGWETVGCETCRPALNYYVSMIWPKECEDDVTSRLVNEKVHANIQKDGTFSVVPRIYGGAARPDEIRRIADIAERYGVRLIKLTGGQRIALIGVRKEDLTKVWKDLGMDSGYAYGKALRTVKTCVGSAYCRYGTQDSLSLGIEMERRFNGLWMPAKVKMSVSGCPRNCAESGVKDIGIVGIAGGWDIYAGGCAGIELKAGERLCTVTTAEEVMEMTGALIQNYREDAHYGERTFKWVNRVGLRSISKAVVDNGENRKALLARLHEALCAVKDPWKQENEGLKRFAAISGPS